MACRAPHITDAVTVGAVITTVDPPVGWGFSGGGV